MQVGDYLWTNLRNKHTGMTLRNVFGMLSLMLMTTTAYAFGSPTGRSSGESKGAEKREKTIAGAAIDKVEQSVEVWVEPVPTAAGCREKEGIEA